MIYQKVHPIALGIGLGFIEGFAIFLATLILVLQGEGGSAFLSKLFPFYEISFIGAFIGLIEGFIDGFIGGFVFAFVYNFSLRIFAFKGKSKSNGWGNL
jgi:uncharacterized membrane-anchored protein